MNIEDDFMWIAGNAFSEMRLMVEGAITLFEDDAGVLCRLSREAQKNEAQLPPWGLSPIFYYNYNLKFYFFQILMRVKKGENRWQTQKNSSKMSGATSSIRS